MTRIALLVPTRGRPEQCRRMVESAANTAVNTLEVHLAWHSEERISYENAIPIFGKCNIKPWLVPDCPTVHKWNVLAQRAMENKDTKLFMLAADDIIFETPGWDKALIDHYEKLENKIHVYHLLDSRNSDGTPHPIVTREYIEAMGYFAPPIFLHWYVDTWTVAIAVANSCFSHFKDFLLTHSKPSDSGPGDETHNRIRRMGWWDRDKYVNETCQRLLEAEKKLLALKIRTQGL